MTTSTPTPTAATAPVAAPTLMWAIKRAVLGLVIMTVVVAGAACLLYFTIDSDAEARAEGDPSAKRGIFYVPKTMRIPG